MTGLSAPLRVVVMGVSGSGKSTVGALLGERLGLEYVDGDDLHPEANIAKMASGVPLDDADRLPWLQLIGERLGAAAAPGLIVGCSALKRSYRDVIRAAAPGTRFVQMHGDRALLERRMGERSGHFMPGSLLASQLATLEPLEPDEDAEVFDVALAPELVAERAADWLQVQPA